MEDDELHITPFDEAALDGSGLIDETIKRRGECISLFKVWLILDCYTNFFDNEEVINISEILIWNKKEALIAGKINSIYENLGVDNNEIIDDMFDYRPTHCM